MTEQINNHSEGTLEIPAFLEVLGFTGHNLDKENNTFTCTFTPSEKLTHSNGLIIQGGFVTGMLDSCMAQFIIHKSGYTKIPLTLDIDVKFFRPCAPGEVKVISKITKEGKSICFTEANLYQDDKLIASSTATNKILS